MRFFLLTVAVVFTSGATATDAVGHLRGDAPQRELASAGSVSTSVAAEVFACQAASSLCFDPDVACLAWADTYAYTNAAGTNAYAEEQLGVFACCQALSYAWAATYVVHHTKTKIDIKQQYSSGSLVDLDANLKVSAATMSISLAESAAAASAATLGFAVSYTDAKAACTNSAVGGSLLCNAPSASTQSIAQLSSGASSSGFSGALGGGQSSAFAATDVDVSGKSITKLKACMTAVSSSFSYAASSAGADAHAYSQFLQANFAQACADTIHKNCALPAFASAAYCADTSASGISKSCNGAQAFAVGAANSCASAFAYALAGAASGASVGVVVKATLQGTTVKFDGDLPCGEAQVQVYC